MALAVARHSGNKVSNQHLVSDKFRHRAIEDQFFGLVSVAFAGGSQRILSGWVLCPAMVSYSEMRS